MGSYPTWKLETETQLRGSLTWSGVPGTGEDCLQGAPETELGTRLRPFQEVSRGDAERREAKGGGICVQWRGDGIAVLSSEHPGRRGDPVTSGGLIPAAPQPGTQALWNRGLGVVVQGWEPQTELGEGWGEKFEWPSSTFQWVRRWGSSMSPSVCVLEGEGPRGLPCGSELTGQPESS